MASKVGWKSKGGFKRVSGGKSIGALRVLQFICNGCDKRYPDKPPVQCGCGRMDFARFDSTGEANRWGQLRLLEATGKITDLKKQQKYDLMAAKIVNNKIIPVKVGEYWPDFNYIRDGQQVIEEFKGKAVTDLALWKLRHMAAQGLPVKIVTDY